MATNKGSIALIYGLITGLVLIGYNLLLYRFGIDAYLGAVARLGYLALFGMAAAAALMERKMRGGYLEFREALKATYTVIVVALALQTLGTFILMNYIDVPFRQAVEKEELKRQVDFMRAHHYPQAQIDDALASDKGENEYTLVKSFQGLVISYVAFFLAALLIAVIVKKKKTAEK